MGIKMKVIITLTATEKWNDDKSKKSGAFFFEIGVLSKS
jgi:hypothetical protein